MRRRLIAVAIVLLPTAAPAQTAADYTRALSLRDTLPPLVVNQASPGAWIGKTHRFVYRKSVTGGHEFVVFDADTRQKRPAFDHAALADAINKAGARGATALKLPFGEVRFTDNEQAITFAAQNARWTCAIARQGGGEAYSCTK
ncbi:MAG: S9 family peptidase, partial [Acidobacteria bacterium]|nr:S9 family peptidase [Acidobacteriota bacterium]